MKYKTNILNIVTVINFVMIASIAYFFNNERFLLNELVYVFNYVGLLSYDYIYSSMLANWYVWLTTPIIIAACMTYLVKYKKTDFLGKEYLVFKKIDRKNAIIILICLFFSSVYIMYGLQWNMEWARSSVNPLFKNSNFLGFAFVLAWLADFCYRSLFCLYGLIVIDKE